MNERIKQLWEDNDTIEVCYPEQGSPVSVSATTLEKFAQLIVKECMRLNSKELSITAIERLLPVYAEHFGVEL